MFRFAVLSSGSCGNSYIFYDGKSSIMIDMGLSCKNAEELIEKADIPLDSLSGIFITHLHPDHASDSLSSFAKKHNCKVYINKFAAKREHKSFVRLKIDSQTVNFFTLGETKVVGDYRVYSIEAFHDSVGCVSYYVTNNENKFCLITDTGYFSPEMIEYADMSNLLFLESNYDDKMIDSGPYPQWLKNRIRSELGHLSNEQALRFLKKLSKNENRKVYLVHLSENNNTKQAALVSSSPAFELNKSIIALDRGEFVCETI